MDIYFVSNFVYYILHENIVEGMLFERTMHSKVIGTMPNYFQVKTLLFDNPPYWLYICYFDPLKKNSRLESASYCFRKHWDV